MGRRDHGQAGRRSAATARPTTTTSSTTARSTTTAARIDSYATFGRTFDLFGDGIVRLAFTPGHSAGHQSVIGRLAERDFVIGGDAIYTLGQLSGAPLPPRPVRRAQLEALPAGAEALPPASSRRSIITPGHDPDFYAKLEKRYS